MNTHSRRSTAQASAAVFLLAALLAALLPGRAGAAPPNPIFPNVVCLWSGEHASSVTGTSGFGSLDTTQQLRRRFQATWTFTPPTPVVPPNPCFVLGTVAESGEVSLVWTNDEFLIHEHGQTDGSLMTLEYFAQFADGSVDSGTTRMSLIVIGDGP